MQLFSFGHPCEHQLRRTCIGGVGCPLNGYPDMWCCSYIKGKINFKRDRPCESQRCRWNFTHPTQTHFEAVTQVLQDGRNLAAKFDETSTQTDLSALQVDAPHAADVVFCAIQMMRTAHSTCAHRIGQLLALGALKGQEPKFISQVLKFLKKVPDQYLSGAYEYVNAVAPGRTTRKKSDIIDDIRSDLVDCIHVALTHSGALVDKEEQRPLQLMLINLLKSFTKNKKKQELLEASITAFPISAQKADTSDCPNRDSRKKEEKKEDTDFSESPRCVGVSEMCAFEDTFELYDPICSRPAERYLLFGGLFGLVDDRGLCGCAHLREGSVVAPHPVNAE